MFSVFFSNRCENLLDALLARREALRLRGPFVRGQVIVPGSALRRRIELAMADRFGVSAGLDFDYLAQWLWRQAARVVEVPEASPYALDALVWRIFAALEGDWLGKHVRLAHYLEGADTRQRFELAGRLARLFDRYLCYRPAWLERWAEGKAASAPQEKTLWADEAWQAELWRCLVPHDGAQAFQLPFMDFLCRVARMEDAELALFGLPAAVDVFCLPNVPPLYLEVLRALARVVDVQLYVLNPCREYWFDIVDARRLSWLVRRQRNLFHETGNRLLAAWGKQAQVLIESLFEGENPVLENAEFTPHPGSHLLARLQNAFLDLQELEAGSIRPDTNDRSIEPHLCHSRIRELEVLHNRLLGLFKERENLRPDEVVVLMPDLTACAPLIEAVFGTAPRERFIPWRITGRGRTEENPVAHVLDDLLALAAGNAPASRVFDLLRQPLVASHFGLTEPALEQVRDWMREAGIHWGLDSGQAHVAGTGGGHTVEAGLARLFLSWAAGDMAGRALFAGQTGIPHAPQGSAGLALGAFWHYARALNHLRAELLQAHDAEGWRAVLLASLAALMGDAPEHADEMRAVRGAVNALTDDMAAAGLDGQETRAVLPLDVIHLALTERLDGFMHGSVPGGAVTFSALPALRGLPYRVVCVIGLDNDAFPARERADEFDLMAASPQKGDRQRRDDERNLFLDAVLAARDVLHLSCIGRSVRDNAELLPSVLVDELLDVLAAACADNPEKPDSIAKARARLVVEHPLQSFSSDYFVTEGKRDNRLESFRGDFAHALNERFRQRQVHEAGEGRRVESRSFEEDEDGGHAEEECGGRPFFTSPLPLPGKEWRCVDLIQLKRFFSNPCRFLLRERLGIDLLESEEELVDVESFVPDWQARHTLAARLLPVLLERGDGSMTDGALFSLARAGGEYPAGNLGEGSLRRELVSLRSFAGRVNAALAKPRCPVHTVKLEQTLHGTETWELRAAFAALRADGQIAWRYGDARNQNVPANDMLMAWLDHLALCAVPPPGVECRTQGLLRNGGFVLDPLPAADARAHLGKLLALYRAGLQEPLRFFPKSGWEYVCIRAREGNEDKARKEAFKKWNDGDFPEKGHAAYRLALRGMRAEEALDDVFRENAEIVFGALWQVFGNHTGEAGKPGKCLLIYG
ncbi:MAG: exodeoxyribonuclease V subunit gamma [Betaproteobacteria bacterium]|nr:exodeoxyribonuclease V subunit gamma [Betaproteobacteria bacterium]